MSGWRWRCCGGRSAVQSTGRAQTDEVETYHDRVREAVVSRLEPDVAPSHHHRLAVALEDLGQADPEVLGLHFLGAGPAGTGGRVLCRSRRSSGRNACLRRHCPLYRPRSNTSRAGPAGSVSFSVALVTPWRAGRGAEAARTYLEAVAHATVATSSCSAELPCSS